MTAAQEIQAAIEKLTDLQALADEGPWMHYDGDVVMGDPTDYVQAYPVVAECGSNNNAELIVTLHRTTDAQLVILELAVAYGELSEGEGSRFITAAKLLARAINGVTP